MDGGAWWAAANYWQYKSGVLAIWGCVCVYTYLNLRRYTFGHRFVSSVHQRLPLGLFPFMFSSSLFWWFTTVHFTFFRLFFNSLFYMGILLLNNVVIVSGEQWRDSAIHIHISILPQVPLPSSLPRNIEQSSLCATVGPCWLSVLDTAVCRSST